MAFDNPKSMYLTGIAAVAVAGGTSERKRGKVRFTRVDRVSFLSAAWKLRHEGRCAWSRSQPRVQVPSKGVRAAACQAGPGFIRLFRRLEDAFRAAWPSYRVHSIVEFRMPGGHDCGAND